MRNQITFAAMLVTQAIAIHAGAEDRLTPQEVVVSLRSSGIEIYHEGEPWHIRLRKGAVKSLAVLDEIPQVAVLDIDRPLTADELAEIGTLASVERLILTFNIDRDALRGLAELKNIRNLTINNLDSKDKAVADELPKHLADLRNLETLWLGTQICDDALEPIGRMIGLKKLGICSSRFDGRGLRHLVMLPDLVELELNCNMRDTPFDYNPLKAVHRLQRIDLSGMSNCDSACSVFSELRQLRGIEINYSQNSNFSDSDLTADGLEKLRKLPKLEHLALGGEVMNNGVDELAKFKTLKTLKLSQDATDETLTRLTGTMPKCDIARFNISSILGSRKRR